MFMNAFGLTQTHPQKAQKGAENEDGFWISSDGNFGVVLDGLGGHGGLHYPRVWTLEFIKQAVENSGDRTAEWGKQLVYEAREHLKEKRKDSPYPIASCTLVMLWVWQETVHVAWCGDSRAYCFQNNALMRLTEDHDVLWQAVQTGRITTWSAQSARRAAEDSATKSEAWKKGGGVAKALFKKRHLMYSELSEGPIDYTSFPKQKGSVFVLCSDGVHDNLRFSEIQEICRQSSPENLHQTLFEKATEAMLKENGKPDDCTVVTLF